MATGLDLKNTDGVGISAISSDSSGIYGESDAPADRLGRFTTPGIYGTATDNPGVWGESTNDVGVGGMSTTQPGVFGYSSSHAGVFGRSDAGEYDLRLGGVFGISNRSVGVHGKTGVGIGVYGKADTANGTGVFGEGSGDGIAVAGRAAEGGIAGLFDGQVLVGSSGIIDDNGTQLATTFIVGDLTVGGSLDVIGYPKSAAVPFPDKSHRRLFSLESPESWFEDFGRATLIRGRARVKLDPKFAAVVRTDDYHVFLSPEGNSRGLYVTGRNRAGFEVREQEGGTNTLRFSFRIVARRKDVEVRRFEKVKLPLRRTRTDIQKLLAKVPGRITLPKLPKILENPMQIQFPKPPKVSGAPRKVR